jgi:long-chain acyl-CoA synthetase
VRIAEPDDSGTGEIQLRGASITAGYRNNPRANEGSFTGDGWFRTGDLGFVDRDGFLFVVGRKKEILVLGGGKKIDPEELERAYQKSAVIAEICVLERDGQLVGLVRPNMSALQAMGTMNIEQAVRTALGEAERTLPPYQRLAGFAITGTVLPRTRLGKFQRFLIRSLYDEARTGVATRPAAALTEEDKAELTDPIAARVWSIIAARYAVRQPALDSHLSLDLGVDSLEWMALSLELEARTGVAFAGEGIGDVQTVRDLIRLLVRVSQQRPGEKQTWQQKIMADQERWLQPGGHALNLLSVLVFAFNKLLMRSLFRLRVEGLERVPAFGPVVLAPNHASDLDPLAVAAALSFHDLRRTYWAGDVARLFGTRLQRFLCRVVRLYPVDERNPSSAIETAAKALARGNLQVWFPEGWRSPDGRLQRFLPGISRLLSASSATILPVYISGTFQALPRTRRWPKLHPIRVIIGDSVTVETLERCGEGPTGEERVASALRAEVAKLAASIGDHV